MGKLFSDIGNLFEDIFDVVNSVKPFYKDLTDDIINDRIINIEQIERQLDYMVTYCFDSEILLLFKVILRKLYYKYPDTVQTYVQLYFDMHGDENTLVDGVPNEV